MHKYYLLINSNSKQHDRQNCLAFHQALRNSILQMTIRVDSASIPVVNVTFANNHINKKHL